MSAIWLVWLEALVSVIVTQLPPVPTEGDQGLKDVPRLFVAERKVDLGVVLEGDKVPVSWRLENRGGADLVIERVKASCGCTTVKLADKDKTIPPGGSLELKAELDSTQRRGKQSKKVTVFTNDTVEPAVSLILTAEIKTLYETRPPGILNLGAIQRGVTSSRALELAPGKGKESIQILGIEFEKGIPLNYEQESFKEKEGTGQRLRFSVAEHVALGAITTQAKINLRVDGIDRTRTVTIRGEVVGDLTFLPKLVDATRQKLRRGQQLVSVTIRSTDEIPFTIVGASAGPAFDVSFAPKNNGDKPTQYVVRMIVRPDAPAGPFGAMLEVRTDSLDQPLVRVPVFGTIAPLVDVEPPLVLLRQNGTAVGTKRRVVVQTAVQDKLEIREIACANQAITAAVDTEASARYHHLRFLDVRLVGKLPPGIHDTVLTLTTTVEGAEHLEIPVTIEVPG